MKTTRFLLIVISLMVTNLSFISFADTTATTNTATAKPAQNEYDPFALNIRDSKVLKIRYFGKGVYYFPYTDEGFGIVLAKFLTTHEELKVTAMAGNVVRQTGSILPDSGGKTSDYGASVGFFVTFVLKERPPAQ